MGRRTVGRPLAAAEYLPRITGLPRRGQAPALRSPNMRRQKSGCHGGGKPPPYGHRMSATQNRAATAGASPRPTVTEYLPSKAVGAIQESPVQPNVCHAKPGCNGGGKPPPYGHQITAVKGRRGDSRIARATEYLPRKTGLPRRGQAPALRSPNICRPFVICNL